MDRSNFEEIAMSDEPAKDGRMPEAQKRPDAKELPEALATFAATAKTEAKVSPNGGLAATSATQALPGDLAAEQDAATRVLREGVLHEDQGADAAIARLPDRTRSR